MAAPTYRVSLGDMAPALAARGSPRQGSIEPKGMMIKHEIQTAAREEPHWNYGSSPRIASARWQWVAWQ